MVNILDVSHHLLAYILRFLPDEEDTVMLSLSCKFVHRIIQSNRGNAITTYKVPYTSFASKRGYLSCLKYAHENGCPWGISTSCSAARKGNLQLLEIRT